MRLLITDLTDASMQRIEHRMAPGVASEAGFLTPGQSLVNVIRRDEEMLAEVGVTPEQIADRLAELLAEAESRFHAVGQVARQGIVVGGRYQFYGFDVVVKGYQECPFESNDGTLCDGHAICGDFVSQDYAVVNGATNLKFGFPVLALHLIRDHHFFEGDVEYRVDPLLAARTLDLVVDSGSGAV